MDTCPTDLDTAPAHVDICPTDLDTSPANVDA